MNLNLRSRVATLIGLAALLVMLCPLPAVAAPPPGIPDGWSSGYAYANGIRIHYYRAGESTGKPVMVMVHGVTDNGLCWTTLTWKLQEAYDIFMLDTRGHGLTDPFTASDDGDTLIKDVVEFVKVMGIEKPILVGHSMGGATVMRIGAEYPDLAKAIVMLDPPTGLGSPGRGGPGARGAGAPRGGPPAPPAASAPRAAEPGRISFSMRGTPEALAAQNNYEYEDLVAHGRRQNPKWDIVDIQYWALSKKQYHGPYSDDAWQAMSGSMRTADSLSRIPVPTLLLKADAAPEARRTHLEAARVMQKGKLVHIDGAGHNLHHDELERTVEVLQEFLSTL